MADRALDRPDEGRAERRATVAGIVSATLLTAAVYLGSGALRTFDAALIGYATATIVLTFAVVYRYAMWIQQPPTRRYFVHGWRAFLSWRNFRRFPTLVPKQLVSYLGLQLFLRERGKGRWLAHQAVFWGVVLATLMTFALSLGMYPVATFRLGSAIDLGIPRWIATTAFWVAIAAWVVTAFGLAASSLRNRDREISEVQPAPSQGTNA